MARLSVSARLRLRAMVRDVSCLQIHQHRWNAAWRRPLSSIWHHNEFVGIEDRMFAERNLPGPDPTEGRGGLIIKLAHYCWDKIFMGDYFHVCVYVCLCVCYLYQSDFFLSIICSKVTRWDGRWTEWETDLMGWCQQSVLNYWRKENTQWPRLSVSLHVSLNVVGLNSKSWFSALINCDIFSQAKCFPDMLISDKTKRNAINSTYPVEKKKRFLDKTVTGILLEYHKCYQWTGISQTDHMTPVLLYSQWPPIKSTIDFKSFFWNTMSLEAKLWRSW